jgi:hypothetical protein
MTIPAVLQVAELAIAAGDNKLGTEIEHSAMKFGIDISR